MELAEDFIVVLDGELYFRSSTLTKLAARDDLDFVRLPPYSPDITSVEEGW